MQKERLAIASNIIYELLFKEENKLSRREREILIESWGILNTKREAETEKYKTKN